MLLEIFTATSIMLAPILQQPPKKAAVHTQVVQRRKPKKKLTFTQKINRRLRYRKKLGGFINGK